MTLFRRLLPLTLLVALLGAVPAAHAKSSQEVTFEAPRDFFDAGKRDAAFQTIDSLGVKATRIILYWKDVAPSPTGRTRPKVDLTDPASYDWSKYQPVLDEAHRRGWKVQLTVSGKVPKWATNGAKNDLTRPRPSDFQAFMTAVSRQFSAQVTRWSIWNEPNHPDFLRPQYTGSGKHKKPASPEIYRKLYLAGLAGLKAAGDTKPVLMGETAPMGTGKVVAPLTFLRGALCLSDSYKKKGKCPKMRVDGYAHHAYTTRQGPFYKPSGPNNVTIGVLSRLTRALDRAARAHVVKARLPVYLTEFGIQSTPDPIYGVSLQRQAEYRSYSEWLSYKNPRMSAFSQYLLTDDAPQDGPPLQRYSGFESGLRTAKGKDKPSLAGFRLPLVVHKVGRRTSLWGLVRPATGKTRVTVQVHERGKKWKKLATVSTNSRGAWTRSGGSAGTSKREWRVLWAAPDGTKYTGPATRALR